MVVVGGASGNDDDGEGSGKRKELERKGNGWEEGGLELKVERGLKVLERLK